MCSSGDKLEIYLDHDIENENINIKLSKVPFDIINGIYDGFPYNKFRFKNNRSHIYIRNNKNNDDLLGPLISCPEIKLPLCTNS